MKPIKTLAAVLALPLLLSSCSLFTRDESMPKSAASDPTAKLAEIKDPWKKTRKSRADKDLLAQDRLEALGEIALQYQDYEASLVNFLEILKRDPQRYDLHYKVGVLFLLSGELSAAQEELALVLVHRPDMLQAHEALGLVFLQQKKYPNAAEEFRLALSQDSMRATSRHLLGVTYLESGQPAKAADELKRAIELDRRQIASYVALAQAYNMLKDYRRAIACLQQGLALDPKNEKLNFQLGAALAGEKRYSEAIEAYMKAGDEAQAYNNIGVHYFVAGQYEDAAKCFQRALELRPTFYEEAKTNLQRALDKLHQTSKDDG